jgi:hypothetical protein
MALRHFIKTRRTPKTKAYSLRSISSYIYTLPIWHHHLVSNSIVSSTRQLISVCLIHGFHSPALPLGVSDNVEQVYADFLGYLFRHTRGFFEEHNLNGQDIWNSLSESMSIIIAHPNGWSIYEQGVLRSAAVEAGISTDLESHQKIIFVTEAEASVQFCLRSSELVASLEVSTTSTILRPETDRLRSRA